MNLQQAFRFDGSDYLPKRDDKRLIGQMLRVWEVMVDGQWRGLRAISDLTGDPEASVSAQLRHLRKPRFGGHTLEKRHNDAGSFFEYRLIPRASQ